MHATKGDRLLVYGKLVGQLEQHGEIIEVCGDNGAPPYRVHFEDGHEALVCPGPDCVVEHATEGNR